MSFVLEAKNLGKEYIKEVGGKAANLAELINSGFPVPEAFFITVESYEKFLESNEIKEDISKIIEDTDFSDINSLNKASEEIKKLILDSKIPSKIRDSIIASYKKLYGAPPVEIDFIMPMEKPFVVVRSSGVTEDIEKASSAGQYETFLNIKGEENLLEAVKKCWASLYTPRAIFYRNKYNQPQDTSIGVIVQRMVFSEKSGVVFTIDPTNPVEGSGKIIIEACWGLGETLVQGMVEPDRYVVDKVNGRISEKIIGEKIVERIRDPVYGIIVERNVTRDKIEAQVLSDMEILALAAICKKIEQHYKFPQDIEWAIERGRIYIVQTRAVTTLEKPEEVEKPEGIPILEGYGASPGIATGIVKIIHDISELWKIEKGDILVTKMTSPDYVTSMEKSVAIVTDEGGITCFSSDTRILTNKGFLILSDVYSSIMEGEQLMTISVNKKTLKTEWKKILNAFKRESNLWRVSISQTGRSKQNILDITPNHKMLTFEKRNLVIKQLNELIKDKEFVCSIDRIGPLTYSDGGNGNQLAYLSGAIFSDGYLKLDNRRGCVVFRQKNIPEKKQFIDAVRNYFSDVFGLKLIDYGEDFYKGTLRGRIIEGSANRYACSKKLPAFIFSEIYETLPERMLNSPREVLLNFLAGIIDGDGSSNISCKSGRLQIYTEDKKIVESIVIACLRLNIQPQISIQRDKCYNIQIVENIGEILNFSNRIKGKFVERRFGTKLFSAKQILSDIIDDVNFKGRIKPYVKFNLLLDSHKILKNLIPLSKEENKEELEKIVKSDLRMLRVKKDCELGIPDVYNIEVEDNNNYIVFTKLFTPVLVNNCHAAIVSRELGVPCIVGTKIATQTLKDDMKITVDATHGKVFLGELEIEKEETEEIKIPTKVEIKVNLAFPTTVEKAKNADGVGLLRLEHMLTKAGMHPIEYIRQNRQEELISILEEGIGKIAEFFYPKPVWVRSLDARTDEFRNMRGGENEPKEDNPMLGWHGIRRSLDETEILKCELRALKQLHEKGLDNVVMELPFIINVSELKKAKEIAEEVGAPTNFGIMVETPAAALTIEEFCKEGIAFASFGSNDLTQMTLGIDRNNERLIDLFDEMHPSMKFLFKHVIETCKKYNVESSICGELPSNRQDAVEFLVKEGINSLSVNIDAIDKVREWVSQIEGENE